MQNLTFTGKTIHAANPFQPNEALMLCGVHGSRGVVPVDDSVTCRNCLRMIERAHAQALEIHAELMAEVERGHDWAETEAKLVGVEILAREAKLDHKTDRELEETLIRWEQELRTTVQEATETPAYVAIIKNYAYRVRVAQLVQFRRRQLAGIPACRPNCQLVHDVAEAEEMAHKINPRGIVTQVGLDQDLQIRTRVVKRCEAHARRGTGYGACDAALDGHGNCLSAGNHVDLVDVVNRLTHTLTW